MTYSVFIVVYDIFCIYRHQKDNCEGHGPGSSAYITETRNLLKSTRRLMLFIGISSPDRVCPEMGAIFLIYHKWGWEGARITLTIHYGIRLASVGLAICCSIYPPNLHATGILNVVHRSLRPRSCI